jgi:hypothetical protein
MVLKLCRDLSEVVHPVALKLDALSADFSLQSQ